MIDSIKKAFVLSVKAIKLFYVLAAFNIAVNVVNFLLSPKAGAGAVAGGRAFSTLVFTILFILAGVLVTCGMLAHVRNLIKTGSADLASFINDAKKYFVRYLGLSVLVLLISLVIGIVFVLLLGIMPNVLKVLLGLVMLLATIALIVLFAMPFYALVGSDLGVIDSLKNGVLFGKKNFFRLLGLIALLVLITLGVVIAALLVTSLLSFILKPIAGFTTAIAMGIVGAIVMLIQSIAYMDFYLKNISQESAKEA